MIPEEDRGPTWLRDYGHTDFGTIEADIAAMQEFAAKLAADVQNNYTPHMTSVSDAMLTRLPQPDARFSELVSFMTAHHAAQTVTQNNVYFFESGTTNMATVAQEIGDKYSGSDAFARAQVADVNAEFSKLVVPPTQGGN